MAIDTKQFTGNILQAFLPKQQQTSTSTTTEKTDISQEGIDAIVRSMMEGNSGLANVMQGQAGAGLYNSTTSGLLANDLAARTAGTAALASAPKTTTQVNKGNSNQIDPKWALGLQLIGELFGGSGDTKSNGPGSNNLGAGFDNIFGTSWFTPKDDDEDKFNPFDNYGGFGFDSGMQDFGMSYGGDFLSSYAPSSYGGGVDYSLGNSLGSSYSGSSYSSYDYNPASDYSLSFNNTGGATGLSFGWSF
jgi:hypothetical protein